MLFFDLAAYFVKLENTPSRLAKIEMLADLLQHGNSEIDKIMYLTQGRVVPFFVNLEFNIGNSLVQKAIADATDASVDDVIDAYSKLGDLGDVANALGQKKMQKKSKLSVSEVFAVLTDLAHISGKDSTGKKLAMLSDLLQQSDPESARYIVRVLLGKLRLGFSDKTLLDALALAFGGDKTKRIDVEYAYYKCSDLGYIAKVIAEEGIDALKKISLIPSVPVFPKLVERASSVDEVLKRIPVPLFQPKYDGMRAQIHLFQDEHKQKQVRIFSRKLEDLTEMFPDIVAAVTSMHIDSVIFDTEVIGFNPVTQEFFPFQETMQRKRKFNIEDMTAKIPVIAFAFDMLYLNGEDLTGKELSLRLTLLQEILAKQNQELITMSDSVVMESKEQASAYFLDCVEKGLEGIIAKDQETPYSPGTRNFEWIKLKRASVSELNDTIDCVVLGYYHGYGQRAKFGIGALLVGIYNPETDGFETIAKIGSGMKDEQLQELKTRLDALAIKKIPSQVSVHKNLIPDVIVDPEMVVEIKADEITKSSVHTAGKNEEGIGYALRFPRLITIREDKGPEDITTIEQIKHIIKR